MNKKWKERLAMVGALLLLSWMIFIALEAMAATPHGSVWQCYDSPYDRQKNINEKAGLIWMPDNTGSLESDGVHYPVITDHTQRLA